MTLEEGLVSYLGGTVSGPICPAPAPEDATYPLIVYQRISTVRVRSMTGPAQLAKARMQLNAYAQTYTAAKTLAEQLRNALDGFQGTMGTLPVSGCFLEDDADVFDISADDQLNRLYGVRMDFVIGYQESFPTYT